jgi:hypothetical protein
VAAFVSMASGAVTHGGPEEVDPDPDDETRVSTERWVDEEGMVAVLRTVVDGGHTWPSALGPRRVQRRWLRADLAGHRCERGRHRLRH